LNKEGLVNQRRDIELLRWMLAKKGMRRSQIRQWTRLGREEAGISDLRSTVFAKSQGAKSLASWRGESEKKQLRDQNEPGWGRALGGGLLLPPTVLEEGAEREGLRNAQK